MKTNFVISLFCILLILSSCGSKNKSEDNGVIQEMVLETPPSMATTKFLPPVIKRDEEVSDNESSEPKEPTKVADNSTVAKKKIIKDGSLSLKVNDIEFSKKIIDRLVTKWNAYYESEDLQHSENTIYYDLKIRIPAVNFEQLIAGIESGGDEIRNKNIQARDVTEEYMDLDSRLANKRAYLNRYKELLSKATTVKDILAIEENIRVIQEEIESAAGRLKYLSDQVSFSTLSVNLFHEKAYIYKPEPQDKFWERVKTSLSNGWTSAVDFLLFIVAIWPYLLVVFLVVFIFRRIAKRRKRSV